MTPSVQSRPVTPADRFEFYKEIESKLKLDPPLSRFYLENVANQPIKKIEAFCEELKSFIRNHPTGISLSAGLGGGVLAALTINHIIVGLPVLALHSMALSALAVGLLMVGLYQMISRDPLQCLAPSSNRLLSEMAPASLKRLEALQTYFKQIESDEENTNTAIHDVSNKLTNQKPHTDICFNGLFSQRFILENTQKHLEQLNKKTQSSISEEEKNIEDIKSLLKARAEHFTANASKENSSEGGRTENVNTNGSIHSTHTSNTQDQDDPRPTTLASSTSSVHSNHSDTSSTHQPVIHIANTPTDQIAAGISLPPMIPSLLKGDDDENFTTAPHSRINSATHSIDSQNTTPLEETTTDEQSIQTPVIGTPNNETSE